MENKPMELPYEWVKKIKVDGIKYESATQHEGLGPAIYADGAMAYAPWLYTCQMNYAELQAKCDKYEKALKEVKAEHADLNLALAAMLNGYQNLSMYQKDWFSVPRDLIDEYTKMVLEYEALSAGEGDVARNDLEDGKELTKYYQGIENAIGFATWLSENGYIRFKGEEWICIKTKITHSIIELYSIFHDVKEAHLKDYYAMLAGLSENIKPGL